MEITLGYNRGLFLPLTMSVLFIYLSSKVYPRRMFEGCPLAVNVFLLYCFSSPFHS